MASKTSAVVIKKTFQFDKITHPKFGTIDPFTFDIQLLSAQEAQLPLEHYLDIGSLKKKFRLDLFKQCREYWPDLLDEEILLKIDNCIELSFSIYLWIDRLGKKENEEFLFLTAFQLVNGQGLSDCMTNSFFTEQEDAQDDEEEEESDSFVKNLSYPLIVSMLPMMDQAAGKNDITDGAEEQMEQMPIIDSQVSIIGKILLSQIRSQLNNPIIAECISSAKHKKKLLKSTGFDAIAGYLLHADHLYQKKSDRMYSDDTYESWLQYDEGIKSQFESCAAIFYQIEIPKKIKKDLLFCRLQTIFAQNAVMLMSIFNLHQQLADGHFVRNLILVKCMAGERQNSAQAQGAKLKRVVEVFLRKIHNGTLDIELLGRQLVKAYVEIDEAPPSSSGSAQDGKVGIKRQLTDLEKYIQLVKHTFNGYVTYFYNQQQKI